MFNFFTTLYLAHQGQGHREAKKYTPRGGRRRSARKRGKLERLKGPVRRLLLRLRDEQTHKGFTQIRMIWSERDTVTGHSQIDREVGLGNGGRGGRGENELKKEGGVGLKEEVSGLQTNRSEEGRGEREGGRGLVY